MYGIPKEFDLSPLVGESTTQVRIGPFDLQFSFGPVNFAIQSKVALLRDGNIVASWLPGSWPDPGFYDILNAEVQGYEVPHERLIVLTFVNGLAMHLEDDSDQYESMQITIAGSPQPRIV